MNDAKAPATARDRREVPHTLNRRCYLHIESGEHGSRLSISLSLPTGFSI